tara:strand:+ start:3851 stop:4384 length:534 start_codon:yes stop_codon:yes gene_type:complete
MSSIEVDKIVPATGTSLTLGDSGDTFTIPSGVTLTNSGTASGFGKIGQVVSGVNSTFATTTSSTYSDTGLTQAITPSATSSKVLIIISASLGNITSAKNNSARILRGSTEIEEYSRVSFNSAGHSDVQNSFVFLDSPSTTSSTTYKLQYKTDGGTLRFNDNSISNPASTITLMEVLA